MKQIPLFQAIRKQYLRWDRKTSLTKRQQFVLITGILTIALLLTQLVSHEWRYPLVALLLILSCLLTAFGLRKDLRGIEWVTLLTLPALFTAAIALFYFLLPGRWLTRIPVVLFYAFGMYALLLTENIYNVAAERSIQLLRAAHTIGFLLTLVTFFLLVQSVLSLRSHVFVNMIGVTVITALLAFQTLWAIELKEQASVRLIHITATIVIVFAQLSWIYSFWPVKPTIMALFFTTCFYSSVGMAQQFLVERLYKKTVIEFAIVSLIVFILVCLTTNWRVIG